jgi:hypothetical protein
LRQGWDEGGTFGALGAGRAGAEVGAGAFEKRCGLRLTVQWQVIRTKICAMNFVVMEGIYGVRMPFGQQEKALMAAICSFVLSCLLFGGGCYLVWVCRHLPAGQEFGGFAEGVVAIALFLGLAIATFIFAPISWVLAAVALRFGRELDGRRMGAVAVLAWLGITMSALEAFGLMAIYMISRSHEARCKKSVQMIFSVRSQSMKFLRPCSTWVLGV